MENIFNPTLMDAVQKMLLAVLLGGLVGWERERSGKPAGLRTNILICLGSTLVTFLSMRVYLDFAQAGNGDPGRVMAQIVTGMGFLGAGAIIQSDRTVVGLTTAATIWVVAAIGMTIGLGYYMEAITAVILVLATLLLLPRIEKWLEEKWLAHRPLLGRHDKEEEIE